LYVHWPAHAYDPAETMAAFDELQDRGLVRRVGVCNFTPDLLAEAANELSAPLVTNQVEYHPFYEFAPWNTTDYRGEDTQSG